MNLPLKDIRVLDLSRVWAGPYATKLLADMGADVIKIEALHSYDPHRGPMNPPPGSGNYPDGDPGNEPWNRHGWFNLMHLSKYGITLDLRHPKGKEVFRSLVAISDAVIENFSYGVLERLGFGYESLRALRPDITYISMPAFGNSGPWKRFISYGIGQEQLSGIASMTGYPDDGTPMKSGINFGDPITGGHAAGAVLAALLYRRRTGKGTFIDLSHLESSISVLGEHILGYQMNGRGPEQQGNGHHYMAPHGVYPCRGEDQWVTIAVSSDLEWQSICGLLERPDLAWDPDFQSGLDRWKNRERLDEIISQWTRDQESYHVTEALQRAGVSAAPVLSSEGIFNDPHNQERGLLELVDHPAAGPHLLPGPGWKMSKTPGAIKWPTPRLGEHNELIYHELLGLGAEGVREMEELGIIGTVPTGGGQI